MIDALGGEPGVRSARFSGAKDKTRKLLDHKNMVKVLKLLQDIPKEKRTARFVCCLCLASPEKVLIETEGVLEGLIAEKELGENGFGYDPIFFVPRLNKTVAQLSAEEKNAISHRGNAIRKLKSLLSDIL
jgi:XTP/dITP diphosphohydrolase